MTDGETYDLELYITGSSMNSAQAVNNLRRICEEWLHDAYRLRVIDVLVNPQAAEDANILATPTLIRRLPQPIQLLVGDLSRTQQVLQGLGLPDRPPSKSRDALPNKTGANQSEDE